MIKSGLTVLSAAALLGLAACAEAEEQEEVAAPAETVDVTLPESDVDVVDTTDRESVDIEGMETTTTDNMTTTTADLDEDASMADEVN